MNQKEEIAKAPSQEELFESFVKEGNVENAQTILNQITDVNMRDKDGRTLMHQVLTNPLAYRNKIEALLKKRADINAQDNEGKTPLYIAAERGCLANVRSLLNKHADANIKDEKGSYPLNVVKEIEGIPENSEIICNLLRERMSPEALEEANANKFKQGCPS